MVKSLLWLFLVLIVAACLTYPQPSVVAKEPKVIKTLSGYEDTGKDEATATTQASVGAAIDVSLTSAQQKAKEPKVIKTLSDFDQDKKVTPEPSATPAPATSIPVQVVPVTTVQPNSTNPPQTAGNNAVEPQNKEQGSMQQVSNPPPTSPSAVKNAADEFSTKYKVLRSK
jgi:hypothetical protein